MLFLHKFMAAIPGWDKTQARVLFKRDTICKTNTLLEKSYI
jgi:hypothetical protein